MTTSYITSVDLEQYFVSKDDGTPLSGGYVQFWKDSDRTAPKLVYSKQTSSTDSSGNPVYTYVALPNPVTLSSVGTVQDANGNNVALYYYPFDDEGNVELYYVAVFNSLGVQQFTREGWPDTLAEQVASENGISENLLTNPQFVDINFDADLGLSLAVSGSGTTAFAIAPGWDLVATYTGAGTITVNRNAIRGDLNYPTNPPYTMTFVVTGSISALQLVQRLSHNPGIWSPKPDAVNGYVATYILTGPTTTVTVTYEPNVGAVTTLLTAANASAEYVGFSGTVQLPASANTATADLGYVDIVINLPTSGTSIVSSVQVVGLETNTTGIAFIQEPVNRQVDHLFNHYKPLLAEKPINSFLTAWDFPLNPAQFLTSTVTAFAIGANKSAYVWDQTIVFQTANSAFTTSRATSGALVLTAATDTQLAIVQYQPATIAREILQNRLAVNVYAKTSSVTALTLTVSLWYTTDVSLPSTIGSNNSIVLTLDADGYPTTQNGTWVPVPRGGLGTGAGDNGAELTMSANSDFADYSAFGWDMEGDSDIYNATFFAIVVGTGSIANTKSISFQSVSLVPGDIATRPAPKSINSVADDCYYYYQKSFLPQTKPATQVGTAFEIAAQTSPASSAQSLGPYVSFPVAMYATPTIVSYNPVSNNAQIRNTSASPADWSATAAVNISLKGVEFTGTTAGGSSIGESCGIHWTADARLGQ
ncbi:MAG: hypothetical protein KIH63_004745 [Candidatus Saccharibacteria bacterium]|nr:hypothetical protein [Candidatus Saccharibacteria bacterium]